MKTTATSPPLVATAASEPASSIAPVPAEDRELLGQVAPSLRLPRLARDGNDLVLERGAGLPTRICVRSGRPAYRVVSVGLRDPLDPLSWYGKRPSVEVGLSRRQWENHAVAVAMTWSFLALGLLLLVTGFFASSLVSAGIGLFTMTLSGLFRAYSPITGRRLDEERVLVRGAAENFLDRVEFEAVE